MGRVGGGGRAHASMGADLRPCRDIPVTWPTSRHILLAPPGFLIVLRILKGGQCCDGVDDDGRQGKT